MLSSFGLVVAEKGLDPPYGPPDLREPGGYSLRRTTQNARRARLRNDWSPQPGLPHSRAAAALQSSASANAPWTRTLAARPSLRTRWQSRPGRSRRDPRPAARRAQAPPGQGRRGLQARPRHPGPLPRSLPPSHPACERNEGSARRRSHRLGEVRREVDADPDSFSKSSNNLLN
jgi:hypothetical protein